MHKTITKLPFTGFQIKGTLKFPVKSPVIFSGGLDSLHLSPHEQKIARKFQDEGFGTMLFDFPDEHEKLREVRKNKDLPSQGLFTSTNRLRNHSEYKSFEFAHFDSCTDAVTALKTVCDMGGSLRI